MNNATLKDARVGGVYNFEYAQPYSGDTSRHLARIVGTRTLTKEHIHKIESESDYRKGDEDFKRTETLVTCEMPNGDYRNFYAERTSNCKCSILGWILFKTGIARIIFRRKSS